MGINNKADGAMGRWGLIIKQMGRWGDADNDMSDAIRVMVRAGVRVSVGVRVRVRARIRVRVTILIRIM